MNRWSQFSLHQLQTIYARLYGSHVPMNRFRIELLLDTAGMTIHAYQRKKA